MPTEGCTAFVALFAHACWAVGWLALLASVTCCVAAGVPAFAWRCSLVLLRLPSSLRPFLPPPSLFSTFHQLLFFPIYNLGMYMCKEELTMACIFLRKQTFNPSIGNASAGIETARAALLDKSFVTFKFSYSFRGSCHLNRCFNMYNLFPRSSVFLSFVSFPSVLLVGMFVAFLMLKSKSQLHYVLKKFSYSKEKPLMFIIFILCVFYLVKPSLAQNPNEHAIEPIPSNFHTPENPCYVPTSLSSGPQSSDYISTTTSAPIFLDLQSSNWTRPDAKAKTSMQPVTGPTTFETLPSSRYTNQSNSSDVRSYSSSSTRSTPFGNGTHSSPSVQFPCSFHARK